MLKCEYVHYNAWFPYDTNAWVLFHVRNYIGSNKIVETSAVQSLMLVAFSVDRFRSHKDAYCLK